MSRRGNPTRGSARGIERRAEREARQLGTAPRPQRTRTVRQVGTGRKIPIIGSLSGTTIAAILGGAVIVAILVYAVMQVNNVDTSPPAWLDAQLDDSTSIPGAYIAPHPGADGVFDSATNRNSDDRSHFTPGTVVPICSAEQLAAGNFSSPLCYQSNPPTSGPHSSTPMPFRVLDNPAPKENLIHNMEHGGVVVWYNTSNQDVINQLKSIVEDEIGRRRPVVMSLYTGMEPETIAVTSWTRLDKFPVADLQRSRVTNFIDENDRRFNPEGF